MPDAFTKQLNRWRVRNPSAYRARQIERSQMIDPTIDGGQALIDLYLEWHDVMSERLYNYLIEAGYEVPDELRPAGMTPAEDVNR